MKINTKTLKALKAAKAAHVSAKTAKSARALTKTGKAKISAGKTIKAAAIDYAALTVNSGKVVLLVSGSKGNAFRLARTTSNKSVFRLCQNNVGLNYDGAMIDVSDSKNWDASQRLEIGNYIAAKGERVTVKVLTVAQAQALAKHKVTIMRNGHEVKIRATSTETQYAGSIERFSTGVEHFFQWEGKKLATNAKHYGALVK